MLTLDIYAVSCLVSSVLFGGITFGSRVIFLGHLPLPYVYRAYISQCSTCLQKGVVSSPKLLAQLLFVNTLVRTGVLRLEVPVAP